MLEYVKIGRRFKINGFYYNFRREYTTKNKYYLCYKKKDCRGSITISPNGQIVKSVEHTCNKTCHEINYTETDTGNESSTPEGSIDKKRDRSRSRIIEEIQEGNTITRSIKSTPSQLQAAMAMYKQDFEEIRTVSENSNNSEPQVGRRTVADHLKLSKELNTGKPSKIKNYAPKIITVDGYTNNFNSEYKNQNKYFQCKKKKLKDM